MLDLAEREARLDVGDAVDTRERFLDEALVVLEVAGDDATFTDKSGTGIRLKIPKGNLVGKVNGGWEIAKRLLQYERQNISGGFGGLPNPVSPGGTQANVLASRPDPAAEGQPPAGWFVTFSNLSTNLASVTAYAVCAQPG